MVNSTSARVGSTLIFEQGVTPRDGGREIGIFYPDFPLKARGAPRVRAPCALQWGRAADMFLAGGLCPTIRRATREVTALDLATLNKLLTVGVQNGASDIHFRPGDPPIYGSTASCAR